MATKPPDLDELNALAIEACDMWQEHLSTFSRDPSARAELTRFLEPQRRLFADWASMMQKGGGAHEPGSTNGNAKPDAAPAAAASPAATKPAPAAPQPGGAAHGDDPLRTAQLALRVAELEKRLGQLEQQLAAATAGAAGASRRTQRATS